MASCADQVDSENETVKQLIVWLIITCEKSFLSNATYICSCQLVKLKSFNANIWALIGASKTGKGEVIARFNGKRKDFPVS